MYDQNLITQMTYKLLRERERDREREREKLRYTRKRP